MAHLIHIIYKSFYFIFMILFRALANFRHYLCVTQFYDFVHLFPCLWLSMVYVLRRLKYSFWMNHAFESFICMLFNDYFHINKEKWFSFFLLTFGQRSIILGSSTEKMLLIMRFSDPRNFIIFWFCFHTTDEFCHTTMYHAVA